MVYKSFTVSTTKMMFALISIPLWKTHTHTYTYLSIYLSAIMYTKMFSQYNGKNLCAIQRSKKKKKNHEQNDALRA